MRLRLSTQVHPDGAVQGDIPQFDETVGGYVPGPAPLGQARRDIVSYTTAVLGVNEAEMGMITMSSVYRLLWIQTNAPARVRLYELTSDQLRDYGRPLTYDPYPGLSIVLDYLTSTELLSAPISPVATGATFDTPLSAHVPITVTSVNGGAITVTLTFTALE